MNSSQESSARIVRSPGSGRIVLPMHPSAFAIDVKDDQVPQATSWFDGSFTVDTRFSTINQLAASNQK